MDADSIAAELDIRPGDHLCAINGESVEDVIDYESLCAQERLLLSLQDENGAPYEAEVEKDEYEPLGLAFETGLMSSPRLCRNHCVFCFIDQLPRGGRETLHVKDDDWRLSLIMGNYVTLTNADDAEFARICKRRVSPLYISVHAANGEVRKRMMRNPTADRLMPRLERLKAEGLQFHAQIVLCPELNDGAVLQETLAAIYALRPSALSVAVVPVGLTRFREGLYPLRRATRAEAACAIDAVEAIARQSLAQYGTPFAYAADEMYILAGRPLPPYGAYGDFPQIENGVGLLRMFEQGFSEALAQKQPLSLPRALPAACGTAAAPFLRGLFTRLTPYGVHVDLHAVVNEYFGPTVTVSGLVTGGDIAVQLGAAGGLCGEALLLPETMLRERDTTFLDGMTVSQLAQRLQRPVWPLPAADGAAFIDALFARLT